MGRERGWCGMMGRHGVVLHDGKRGGGVALWEERGWCCMIGREEVVLHDGKTWGGVA